MKKEINYGIEILRVILCFWVVIVHCSLPKKEHRKYLKKGFHVPTFILISFYFYYKTISNRKIDIIISRLQRLFIPYVLWPIIIFIFNNTLFILFSVGILNVKLTLRDLYIQILIGSRFHGFFWFQFNLIILSIYFAIVSFIFKKNMLKILQISGAVSFYLHISGINYNYFISFKWGYAMNTGYFVELMPLAIFGVILGSISILKKTINFSLTFYFLATFTIYCLFEYDLFISFPGFKFPNTILNLFASTTLFVTFASFPFYKINNEKFGFIIKNITSYTGGIYYLHYIIKNILEKISPYLSKKKTYFYSLFIYILCYFICFSGKKLFSNHKLKYLFI